MIGASECAALLVPAAARHIHTRDEKKKKKKKTWSHTEKSQY